MLWSRRTGLLSGGFVLALAGALGGWYVYSTRPGRLLSAGQAALAQGDLDRAEELAERLEQKGHVLEARLLHGSALVRQGQAHSARAEDGAADPREQAAEKAHADAAFREALRELSSIRADDPVAAEGTVLAAECLARLGERRLAAEVLNALVQRLPDHREAHRWLAAVYMDLNAPLDATTHLREWARLDREEGRPCRWLGFFYKDYNRPAQAIEAYREALRRRLDPALRAEVSRELAEVLIAAQADYQAALAALDECPQPAAGSPECLVLRADCLWNLGQQDEAVRVVDAALSANPSLVAALLLRARIHLAADQPPEAIPHLERALRIDPSDLKCRQHLMEAYRQTGDAPRAEQQRQLLEESKDCRSQLSKLHEQALQAPWDDSVRYQIALLCLKLNHPREARTWLQAALASNPRNASARQALDKLAGTPCSLAPSR
jgi:tetratricopeptide (TPR) repeat protein